MIRNEIGIIAESRAGIEFAKNFSSKGIKTSFYIFRANNDDLTYLEKLIAEENYSGISITTLADSFFTSLQSPKKIFIFGKSQSFSRDVLSSYEHGITKYLSDADIVVDCSDVSYDNALENATNIEAIGLSYITVGISGREYSIDRGLSLIPSGKRDVYESIKPILDKVSARVSQNFLCDPYVGDLGSGIYVKMINNAIEYGIMEAICEAINVAKELLDPTHDEMVELLNNWNQGGAESYSLEVFCDIYRRIDSATGAPIVDIANEMIGFGNSVNELAKSAIKLNVPIPTIAACLNARFFSNMAGERVSASRLLRNMPKRKISPIERDCFADEIRSALVLTMTNIYVEAFALLAAAGAKEDWNVNILQAVSTLSGNSYIRSKLLDKTINAFKVSKNLTNLYTSTEFMRIAEDNSSNLRDIVKNSISSGLSLPAMSATITYIDTYRSPSLGTGIIELCRDYLNKSGYNRDDAAGLFHAQWDSVENEIDSVRIENEIR